ncbi:MAG: addiction module toxin RelE [Mucilaginibacter sp.]|nr:addiction module toxin RelE [Mucilaginibacter sp.]
MYVRILARSTLRDFWEQNPDAETGLKTWFAKIKKAEYNAPADIIKDFKGADYVDGYIVFNIAKNKYRLVAAFRYDTKSVTFILLAATPNMTKSILGH